MALKIKFFPDLPVAFYTADRLNFREFAQSLQMAIYRTSPPFVYGVLGDWGSGKTSILNLLYNLLNDDLQNGQQLFVPIRFDAWKYENEENLVFPLLHTIRKGYVERTGTLNQGFVERFKEVALTGTLALTDVALRSATKTLTGEALKLDDLAEHFKNIRAKADAVEDVLSGWADQVDHIQEAFSGLLSCYAEDLVRHRGRGENPEQVRFVLLVDDLDRCLPQTVIGILESIKNYLLTQNCVFILALNPRVVYEGIRVKYSGFSIDGREYLEKIVNYSFYVPEPLPQQAADFARQSLEQLIDPDDAQRLSQYLSPFGQAVHECNFTNPRKVKRILNHYLFFLSLHEEELGRFSMPNIVRLIVLAEYFPTLFQLFIKNAEMTRDALQAIDKSGFDQSGFVERYGIDLQPIHAQLRYMGGLLALSSSNDSQRASLTEHAVAVFQIVHHPV